MLDLQSAVELDEFWRATKRLLASAMPHHSCSLMLGIVDYQPLASRHHVAVNKEQDNRPLNSLSIARPYLAAHPRLKLHTAGISQRSETAVWPQSLSPSERRVALLVAPGQRNRWLTEPGVGVGVGAGLDSG